MRFLTLLFPLVVSAQSLQWKVQPTLDEKKQPMLIGAFQRFGVRVTNPTATPLAVTSAQFYAEAERAGVQVATNSELLLVGDKEDNRSWQRTALLFAEGLSYGMTFVSIDGTGSGDKAILKIKERGIKTGISAVGPALRLATTMIKQPKFELPANSPRPVTLAPGDHAEFTVYGTPSKAF